MLTRQSFEAFTSPLKVDPRFYLCNRGIVINLEHAVDFDGTGIRFWTMETRIPVSRKLIKDARQTFMELSFPKGDTAMNRYSVAHFWNSP